MLIHCTMDDLIAVRDGEGPAAARRHLEECPACRLELERLAQRVARLRALPTLRPPRDRWDAIRGRFAADRRRRRWLWGGWATVAAAAALVLTFGVRGFSERRLEERQADRLASLVQESQQLDAVLRGIDSQGRVVSGRTASAIADLEDRLEEIDARLANTAGGERPSQALVNLWRRRVQLQDALVGVHVTRAAHIGL